MIAFRSVLTALVLLVAVPGAAAAAPVQDASEAPRTSGPLFGSPLDCEDDGPPGPNETRMRTCVWSYDLLPAETNATEDYTGYWIQLEVDPAPGWCVFGVDFDTSGPDDGRIASAAPQPGRTGGETTVELVVDAEGAAPLPGTIAQDFDLPKGRIRTSLDPHHFAYSWSGRAKDKIVVGTGVQVTHPLPPSVISTWYEGVGVTFGSCRPMAIAAIR
jgi:hypothetical protein